MRSVSQGEAGDPTEEAGAGARRPDRQPPHGLPIVRISRSSSYVWKAAYGRDGEAGPVNKKPCAYRHPKAIAPELVDQILHLRRTYHLGPRRIVWSLKRYHGQEVSGATVYRPLERHGLNRQPHRVGCRAGHTHRYEKQVPGHHIQVDVPFLTLQGPDGQRSRRYQYTAIDDATRVRALKVDTRHTQANAMRCADAALEGRRGSRSPARGVGDLLQPAAAS